MKRILILTPNCPFPPYKSGGTHALYNMIKNKFNNDYIDLVYYDEEDNEAEKEIKRYVNDVIYIPIKKKNIKVKRIISILKRIPFGIYQYDSKRLIISEKYDLVIFDQNLSLDLVNYIECKNKVLMAYDSMQLYFKRKSQINSKISIANLYNLLQSKFYDRIKTKNYYKFNKIYFVSEKDSDYEKESNPDVKDRIDYIKLGVDYNKFNLDNYNSDSTQKSIIFTGIMDYAPNKDAVMFFCKSIMPILINKHPDLIFYIVGKNPDEDIKKLKNKNVVVTGFVEDIVECIARATVYISPLRYGTGMKNKVLEAMSTGKAIVASPISVEGIDELKHSDNIFIANREDDWIKYVDVLLNDENRRNVFSEKCRGIILENYNWEKSYEKLTKFI